MSATAPVTDWWMLAMAETADRCASAVMVLAAARASATIWRTAASVSAVIALTTGSATGTHPFSCRTTEERGQLGRRRRRQVGCRAVGSGPGYRIRALRRIAILR